MKERYLYAGLIKLHVLYHAAREPVYGLAMIEALGRHGYKLSAGTLYPILHGLEERGYLVSTKKRTGSTERRLYKATRAGQRALVDARLKVRELFGELFADRTGKPHPAAQGCGGGERQEIAARPTDSGAIRPSKQVRVKRPG